MGSRSEGAEHPRIVAVRLLAPFGSVKIQGFQMFYTQPKFLTNGSNGSNGKCSIFLVPNLCLCFTSITG